MKFLGGFLGAIFGAALGCMVALFGVQATDTNGDIFGGAFALAVLGPTGLLLGAILGSVLALLVLRSVEKNAKGQKAKRRNFIFVSSCIVAVPLLIGVLFWGTERSLKMHNQPPPDQQLLDNFQAHRVAFDKLIQMSRADKGSYASEVSSAASNTSLPGGTWGKRIAEYRHWLDAAKIFNGFSSDEDQEVKLCYWGFGSAISSDMDKGYAYLAVPPKQVLKTLDACQPDEKNGVEAYRHIEGPWYLYYEYLPG